MELTAKHHEYWRKNIRITMILLAIWFVVTFVVGWLRARPVVPLLRLAVLVLDGRAGRARRSTC